MAKMVGSGGGPWRRRQWLRRLPALLVAVCAAMSLALFLAFPAKVLDYLHRHSEEARNVLRYRLHSKHGLILLADLGSGHPGDIVSTMPFSIKGAARVAVSGLFGRRIKPEGDSFMAPMLPVPAMEEATYSLSVAPDGVDRRQELFNAMGGTSGATLWLDGGRLVLNLRNGVEVASVDTPFVGSAGHLTDISAVFAPGEVRIYQNGVECAHTNLPWKVSLQSRAWSFSSDARFPFLGVVEGLAVWRRALGAAEIRRFPQSDARLARELEPVISVLADALLAIERGVCVFYRVFDRLIPARHGTAVLQSGIPVLVLHMNYNDERHFSRVHEKSLFNGFRTSGAASFRSIGLTFNGRHSRVEAGLDDSYSLDATAKRPAFLVVGVSGELGGGCGIVRLYPPELHAAFHPDAPDIFPLAPRFVRLFSGSTFKGLYIAEPLDSPGSAWMEYGKFTHRALYSDGAPKLSDILPRGEDARETLGRTASVILSDNNFPWSAAEIKLRRAIKSHRDHIDCEKIESQVAPVSSILGENFAAMFVTGDLALPQDGIEWSSSDSGVVSPDGKVSRPAGSTPAVVTLEARDVTTGARQEYRLRVMPEKPTLPALFLGIGRAIDKRRRDDFVCAFVGTGGAVVRAHGLVGMDGGVRHRGNSSYFKGVKRSLSLEFSEPFAWPDTANPQRHLLLHSGYSDPTRLRNRIAFEFYHDAVAVASGHDLPAPRFDWTEVFVNGEYFGVWEASGRVRDLIPSEWPIYKIRGLRGWLWNHSDTSILDCVNGCPDDPMAYEPIGKAFDFVANSPNEEFAAEAESRFDIGNLAACYLMLNFTGNNDGVFMNQYFAVDPGSGRTFVVPWDYDKTFLEDREEKLITNRLYSRMLALAPPFADMVGKTWETLRAGPYSDDAFDGRLGEWVAMLAPSMGEEWRLLKPKGFDGDFDEAVRQLAEAVRRRFLLMDKSLGRKQ